LIKVAYAKRNLESLAMDGRLVHIASGGPIEFSVSISDMAAKRAVITASRMRPLELDKKRTVVRELTQRVWPHLGNGRAHPHSQSMHRFCRITNGACASTMRFSPTLREEIVR